MELAGSVPSRDWLPCVKNRHKARGRGVGASAARGARAVRSFRLKALKMNAAFLFMVLARKLNGARPLAG